MADQHEPLLLREWSPELYFESVRAHSFRAGKKPRRLADDGTGLNGDDPISIEYVRGDHLE